LNRNPHPEFGQFFDKFHCWFNNFKVCFLPGQAGGREMGMIRISTRLSDGAVLSDVKVGDKEGLLSAVAAYAAKNYGIDAGQAQESLVERERLGPTGFGGGTAIPHCKVAGLDAPVGVFVRLEKPIDYDAIDDEPVDLVFTLFSPAHDGASHLKALAEVSRMFRDEASRAQLRGAKDAAALYALLVGFEERDAA
jgi:nitrogen PTS system EIIA component